MRNVLFVIESLHCGGAEKSLVNLLSSIDLTENKVDLLLFTRGGEFEKFLPEQIKIIDFGIKKSRSGFYYFFARIIFWLKKRLKKNRKYNSHHTFWLSFHKLIPILKKEYDVAIAYSQGFASYFVAEKTIATKKFSWLNTDYKKAKHYAKFDYKYYSKFDKIVCVSKECESSLLNEMKLIKKDLPTFILKDISDQSIINELSISEPGFQKKESKEITILTVCRLVELKGIHLAISACRLLLNEGLSLKWYVIGDGPERKFLEKEIIKNGLSDAFILLGFKENPYSYMRSCDIYVQTSLFEGLGLTVIEASILNKPIVTTDFDTAPSIITHNKTGLICKKNPESIANNILKLIKNENFRDVIVDNLSNLRNSDKEKSLNKFNSLLSEKS